MPFPSGVLWSWVFGVDGAREQSRAMAQPREQESVEASPAQPGRILLVDDQPELRRLFRRSLNRLGHEVVDACHAGVAIELARQSRFDLVISDMRMPDMNGLALLTKLQELDADLPVLLMSGGCEAETERQARELGAFGYLLKPRMFEVMGEYVAQAIALRRQRAAAREDFEPFASVQRLRIPGDQRSR